MQNFDRKKYFQSQSQSIKYFIKEEIDEILNSTSSVRDHLIMDFMWRTGTRVSEMLAVRPIDIDKNLKTVKISTLKQKTIYGSEKNPVRVIPLQEVFLEKLFQYIADNKISSNDRLFLIGRKMVHLIVKKACERVGFKDKRSHPHVFRHSFAIHCLLNKVPTDILQKLLGHKWLGTTMVYTHMAGIDTRPFMDALEF